MADIFAELMAFLFAKNKKENSMRPAHSSQLLASIRKRIYETTQQKEGE